MSKARKSQQERRLTAAFAKAFALVHDALTPRADIGTLNDNALSPTLREDIGALRELRDIISHLTSVHWMDYSGIQMVSQAEGRGNMIVTEEVSQGTQRLLLRSHIRYYRQFCCVCERDWITTVLEDETEYLPPTRCKFLDCRSKVWNNPIEAIPKRAKRLEKLARQKARKGNIKKTPGDLPPAPSQEQ
jgi:hypothetical protein